MELPESKKCPRCHSAKSRLYLTSPDRQFGGGDVFTVAKCQVCGLAFQNPEITPEKLSEHYPKRYNAYLHNKIKLPDFVNWHLRNKLGYSHIEFHGGLSNKVASMAADVALCNLIPEFVKEGRVLEIGCATGARLDLFRSLGWQKCIGSEFSSDVAQEVKDKGFKILTGSVENHISAFKKNEFDAVIAGFVIEHFSNPFETTFRLAEKIKPGGQFIFSTINISTPDFKIYGPYWYNLDLPRHMVLFRVCDVIQMLTPQFKIERILYQSALNDYIGSAKYRIPSNCGIVSWVFDRLLLKNSQRIGPILSLLGKLSLGSRIYISARKL